MAVEDDGAQVAAEDNRGHVVMEDERGQAVMEDARGQVVMEKAAGLSSPSMGSRIVATGGVRRRRTEPVVIADLSVRPAGAEEPRHVRG